MKKFLLMLVGAALVTGARAEEWLVSEKNLQIDIQPQFDTRGSTKKDFSEYKNFFVLTKTAFNEWKANDGKRSGLADASWAFGEAKSSAKAPRLRYIKSAATHGSFGKLPIKGEDVVLPADPEGNTKYILVMASATDYYSLQLRTDYVSSGRAWILDTAVGGTIAAKDVSPEAFALEPWPEDWPEIDPADVEIREKYSSWMGTYNVTDPTGKETAFLFNTDPNDDAKTLEITRITVEEGAQGAGLPKIVVSADDINLGKINGYLYVIAGDTLTTMTEHIVEFTIDEETGIAIGNVDAHFMKATIGFKKPVVEE